MKFQNPFRSKAGQQQATTSDGNRQDKQALKEFQAGRVGAVDRFGRQIHLGDGVVYEPPNALVFQVVSAAPNLERGMPRGVVQLTLVCTVPVNCMGNTQAMPLMVVSRHGHSLVPVTLPDEGQPEPPKAPEPSKLILP